ncbi:hypothetical protein H2200_004606 [Cladophialophora chaetospira]|uniref:Uncharacterized protein n=1 Tax=Cladophialophora chaetospira TaxID=386627 RepID=A0AA38XE74_9EURO|nr:hypothetical protein H2200_004606 [Cladophialophora chaetospira]
MTPNLMKGQTDTSKFAGQDPKGTASADNNPAKNPMTEYNPAPGSKAPAALSSDGAIGKQFKADGPMGSIPQSIGGPFDQKGVIGGAFSETGALGGTVNKILGHTPGDQTK